MNTVNLLPLVAFFVPRPAQWLAGILPPYWPMRALWSAASGEAFAGSLVAGAIVSGLTLLLCARLFHRRVLASGVR